jgi:hypothetical protein
MASARIWKPGPALSLLATGPLLAVALVGSLAAAPTACPKRSMSTGSLHQQAA